MLKLVSLTAAAIFTAEALVMLFVESLVPQLPLPLRVFLDSFLLTICVFPSLYFLVFKDMAEQISFRREAELMQKNWNQNLELEVEERTERLIRANEDLLVEVRERARATMALRAALNEARHGRLQLTSIINAVGDAIVVVDSHWHVKLVNNAAEEMFRINGYELQNKSLKEYLSQWAPGLDEMENFFVRGSDRSRELLISPVSNGDAGYPVQMRFGADIDWEGQPATVLVFSCRADLN